MAIDIDDVVTHEQLDEYLGGQLTTQTHLLMTAHADGADLSGKLRAWALAEVLEELAARTPPVLEADVTTPSELRRAVRNLAARQIFEHAMTSGGEAELWHAKMVTQSKRYDAAMSQLSPTVATGVKAPASSIGISRR